MYNCLYDMGAGDVEVTKVACEDIAWMSSSRGRKRSQKRKRAERIALLSLTQSISKASGTSSRVKLLSTRNSNVSISVTQLKKLLVKHSSANPSFICVLRQSKKRKPKRNRSRARVNKKKSRKHKSGPSFYKRVLNYVCNRLMSVVKSICNLFLFRNYRKRNYNFKHRRTECRRKLIFNTTKPPVRVPGYFNRFFSQALKFVFGSNKKPRKYYYY